MDVLSTKSGIDVSEKKVLLILPQTNVERHAITVGKVPHLRVVTIISQYVYAIYGIRRQAASCQFGITAKEILAIDFQVFDTFAVDGYLAIVVHSKAWQFLQDVFEFALISIGESISGITNRISGAVRCRPEE